MRKLWFFTPLLLMFASLQAFGANWYVAKVATGSNNGTNWTNAWNEMSQINWSSVACGDTIWIAGNNGSTAYSTAMSGFKTCTSGSPVLIRRVTSSDSVPVSAAGWQSTFDSQVVINNVQIIMSGGYWTIDGRTGDAQSSVPYGIVFNNTTDGWLGVFQNNSSGTLSGIELTYIEIHGPACATNGSCSNANHALELDEGGATNLTVDHSWLHQFSEVIHGPYINTGTATFILQYSYIGEDVMVTSNEHEDLLYTSNPCAKMEFVGNRWYSSGNDGIFMDNAGCNSGFLFVNNIMFHWGGWAFELGKSGTCGPYVIVNNTFANDGLGSNGGGNEYPYGFMGSGGCTLSTSSLVANNIFYNAAPDSLANSYTVYDGGTTSNGNSFSCGTSCFSYALASPIDSFNGFVDFVPSGSNSETIVKADLHLSSAGITLFQGKGENLTSQCTTYPQICTDLDGNARPATGAWDLGAYVAAASGAAAPVAPTGLTATVQ